MTDKQLFDEFLYDATDDNPLQFEVARRYVCSARSLDPHFSQRKLPAYLSYFTAFEEDDNSCADSCYANLDVFDIEERKSFFGRLQLTVNRDLTTCSKYSFMLFLKESESDPQWQTAISVTASSIKILST